MKWTVKIDVSAIRDGEVLPDKMAKAYQTIETVKDGRVLEVQVSSPVDLNSLLLMLVDVIRRSK